MAWAEMKKSIYSLAPLRELLLAANRRYLEFISTIEDDKAGTDKLHKISQPVEENDRSYRPLQLLRSGGRRAVPITWQRRVQHPRFPERRPASARRRQEHGPSLPSDETTANPRPDQKDCKNLQILPHRPGEASHPLGPQAQKPLPDSRTLTRDRKSV